MLTRWLSKRAPNIVSKRAPNIAFVSEHEADSKYTVTAAASIVAKVTRDRRIAGLNRVYGDVGSGYPSDPRTMRATHAPCA